MVTPWFQIYVIAIFVAFGKYLVGDLEFRWEFNICREQFECMRIRADTLLANIGITGCYEVWISSHYMNSGELR